MSQFNATNVDFSAIIRQMQQQEAQRREDALSRYAQANNLAGQLTDQIGAMGTYGAAESQLDMVGDAARERIGQSATQQFAQADQDLVNRGLGNTTVRSSVQRGISMDEQRAKNELDEGIAAQRSGLLERRADSEFRSGVNEIDTLLSRVDEPIDYGLLSGLMQQAAATPEGRQEIFIGGVPSNSIGGNYRGTPGMGGAGGGGGGGGSGRTGVKTFTNSGLSSFTDAAGSQGTGGVQTFTGRATPQQPQRRYSSGGSRTGQNRESAGSGYGMTSYYGGQSGNSAESSLAGYAFGPGIMEGTTASMPTGGGSPVFQLPSGAITNDPSGEGMSSTMGSGSGMISGPGGVFGVNPGEEVDDLNTDAVSLETEPPGEEPEEEMQRYYRPGLLGWQDVKSSEFASAAEAKAAGYPYSQEQYLASKNR